MPPHRLLTFSSYINPRNLSRGIKCLLLATTVALGGCATNNAGNTKSQFAEAGSGSRSLRDNYLSHTRSDPLGAYLNNMSYSSPGMSDYSDADPGVPKALASTALNFLGIKYRYGGGTPYTGFDCSGLVIYAAEKSLGLKLPRSSAEIAREGTSVKLTELKKGDLVFFNTRGRRNSHVGIYLGDQKFVHAPRAGSVVRVENMDQAYWKKRYNGARRLASDDASGTLAIN